MSDAIYQCNISEAKGFLLHVLSRHLDEKVLQWLEQKSALAASSDKELFMAFSSAPKFLGSEKVIFTKEQLEQAQKTRAGWNPVSYTADCAGRIFLLLSVPYEDAQSFRKTTETLFSAADVNEMICLCLSLAVLPHPAEFISLAAECTRSNMSAVFNAVALDNPYPHDFFQENQWNQMVLKAIFIGSPLFRVYGIDERRNKKLAEMAVDFAHERWAAGRSVTPELWRCVAPFVDEKNFENVKKLSRSTDEKEQKAAALVCCQHDFPEAKKIFAVNKFREDALDGKITWDSIGESMFVHS